MVRMVAEGMTQSKDCDARKSPPPVVGCFACMHRRNSLGLERTPACSRWMRLPSLLVFGVE